MYKIILEEEDVPKYWYNINADLPSKLPEFKDTTEGGLKNATKALTKTALKQETSTKRHIKIPQKVRQLYQQTGRPRPLYRATNLEKHLNTPAKIYYKREDQSPTGSHKLNSAIPQAYYAKKEGATKLTTETGAGQWGTALSLACSLLDLQCQVYMVNVSYKQKPLRKQTMELYGGHVVGSPSTLTQYGRNILEKNPNHPGSLGIAISEAMEEALENPNTYYSLGSVLNHVILHQTTIGLETQTALEKENITPDTIIGCVGGGTNFGGMAFPFIKEQLKGNLNCKFLAMEPAACPTLTQGEYRYDYADTGGYIPQLKMYTLGKDFIPPALHAGGLRYHGMSTQISLLKQQNTIQAQTATEQEIFTAGALFAKTEGIIPAPETSHAIAGAIKEAQKAKQTGEPKNIVICFSGHGMLDLNGYADYLNHTLPNNK